jgi:hypothetical protein
MLDTQQQPLQQENKQKEMDVENKPKEQQPPPRVESQPKTSNGKKSATQEYNDYLKTLKDSGIDILNPKTHGSFLKTVTKLKKAAETENKMLIDYASKIESANSNIDPEFIRLMKTGESLTPEQAKFNEFVACNAHMFSESEARNKRLQEEINALKTNNNGKNVSDVHEPPRKKHKSDNYQEPQNNNTMSKFIPYGNEKNFQEVVTGGLLLKNLLNHPSGYFPTFNTQDSDYNDSIINGSRHAKSAIDSTKISNV